MKGKYIAAIIAVALLLGLTAFVYTQSNPQSDRAKDSSTTTSPDSDVTSSPNQGNGSSAAPGNDSLGTTVVETEAYKKCVSAKGSIIRESFPPVCVYLDGTTVAAEVK